MISPDRKIKILTFKSKMADKVTRASNALTYDVGPAGLEPAKPARDAARALGNCIARNQDPDSFVIGQFYGSARALIGSLSVTVAVYK